MTTRREFFAAVAGAMGAVVLARPEDAQAKSVAVKLAQVPKLKEVGGSTIVKIGGEEIMLIRDGNSSVRALSPICTHAACYVSYNHGARTLDCACHKSSFTLGGKVLGGPAKDDLETYRAKLDGDRIVIRGV